ncbi:MAG: FAD-dependent thymidylate synthase [Spirochaetaceae bacterium]|nr:FAD-dependent thymidylate synthase [Spirochaetaceae bacterium]
MAHCTSPAAEQVLDREFRVLDKGFVRLVDYLGNDGRIVQAARVSYGDGTKSYREDAGLIDYLLRNRHTSPFEQVVLTFHMKLPVFIARQIVRHRTARLNEISGRYSVMKDDFYVPEAADLNPQSESNKQARGAGVFPPEEAAALRAGLAAVQAHCYGEYQKLIAAGLAREVARINLPLSLYTEWYWQIDLNNLFHFLELRLGAHAQKEVRDYARVMFDLAKTVAPAACAAFEEHIAGSCTFSRSELRELRRRLADGAPGEAPPLSAPPLSAPPLSAKALERFEEKLRG